MSSSGPVRGAELGGVRGRRYLASVEIERSIVINRSIGDAFDFVSDARSDPRWSPKLDSVEQVSGETVLAPEAAT